MPQRSAPLPPGSLVSLQPLWATSPEYNALIAEQILPRLAERVRSAAARIRYFKPCEAIGTFDIGASGRDSAKAVVPQQLCLRGDPNVDTVQAELFEKQPGGVAVAGRLPLSIPTDLTWQDGS